MYEAKGLIEEEEHVLKIEYDGDAKNPREFTGVFTTLYFWSSKYSIGNNHSYETTKDFLADLADECKSSVKAQAYLAKEAEKVFGAKTIASGNFFVNDSKQPNHPWKGEEYSTFEEGQHEKDRIYQEWADEEGLQHLTEAQLLDIIRDEYYISPLYFYEHSDTTLSLTPWRDEDTVSGYIFAKKTDFISETKLTSHELFSEGKAKKILETEIQKYDYYRKGETFSLVVEKVISCNCCHEQRRKIVYNSNGFYGLDIDKNGMKNSIESEFIPLLEKVPFF